MPNLENIDQVDSDLNSAGVLSVGKVPLPEMQLGNGKPGVVESGTENASFSEPTEVNPIPATQDGKEKRREHRFVINDPASLQILNPFSSEYSDVCIKDVSKHGLGLHVSANVLPGSLVKVRIKGDIAFGRAQYCVRAAEGFFVGVHIHDYVSQGTEDAAVWDEATRV